MANAGRLSKADIAQLAANPSEKTRAKIASKVGQEVSAQSLTRQERELANSILSVMVKDAAHRVRTSLSESLRHAEDVPHEVVLTLARDIDEVALPVLESSPVLEDEDLIEIVGLNVSSKQVAIAKRQFVPESVSEAIVRSDNVEATTALIENDGAQMSEPTFNLVIENYSEADQIREALVRRTELPSAISERLVTMVSGRLRKYLTERHNLSEYHASMVSDDTRERATVDLVQEAAKSNDIISFVEHLRKHGRLTPSLIVRAICTGDVRFFEAAMAGLSGLPIQNARLMIHDVGSLGMRALFERTRLPKIYFPIFRVAIDVLRETELDGKPNDLIRFRRRMIERILTQYIDIDPEDIDYLIRILEGGSFSSYAA